MIPPIHEVMAYNPGGWVMLPISGEVANCRRVERRLIRYFDADFNIKVAKEHRTKKGNKGKRNRPVMAIRNKSRKIDGKQALCTFTVNNKKGEDLFEAMRGAKGVVTIDFDIGAVDATNWCRIWKEFAFDVGRCEDKMINTWREVKKRMKKVLGGEMVLEGVRRHTRYDYWVVMMVELVRLKVSITKIAEERCDNDIWMLHKACNKIRGKGMRIKAKKAFRQCHDHEVGKTYT
jgi:hypothetical protein